MRKLAISLITICIVLYSTVCSAQESKSTKIPVTMEDISSAIGEWTGTLTYMNYSDGTPFSMPAKATISIGKNSNELDLYYVYPNEPHANSSGKLRITKNGHQFNGHKVVSKSIMPDGQLQIVTEHNGKDNKQKATINNIYTLSVNQLIISKKVTYKKSGETIIRNEYRFER